MMLITDRDDCDDNAELTHQHGQKNDHDNQKIHHNHCDHCDDDQGDCEDNDECTNGELLCSHQCINTGFHDNLILLKVFENYDAYYYIVRSSVSTTFISTMSFSLDPFLQKGSSLQVENLSSFLSVITSRFRI